MLKVELARYHQMALSCLVLTHSFLAMPASFNVIETYLKLVESCSTDRTVYTHILHPEVEQTEYPNLYTKTTQYRNLDGIMESVRDSRELVDAQRIQITRIVQCASEIVVVEMKWEGTLAIETNRVRRGQLLKGNMAMVFELRDEKIYRQRSYICYEPF